MNRFWEQSPLWQRERELSDEWDAVQKAMTEAGESVLALIRIDADAPRGQEWRNRRQAYLEAVEEEHATFREWCEADRAFKASPIGQAYIRYLADPLAFRKEAAESEAA